MVGTYVLIAVGALFLGLIIAYVVKKTKKKPHTPVKDRPKDYLGFLEEVKTVVRNYQEFDDTGKRKLGKRGVNSYLKSVKETIEEYHTKDPRFEPDFYAVLAKYEITWYTLP